MAVTKDTYCTCLFYSASALARSLSRLADEAFAGTGLTPSLGFIVMTVNKAQGITAGKLAGIMQLQPSTITRLIDKLEREGYVTRRSNGRFTKLLSTAKAARIDPALREAWRLLERRYSHVLGEKASRDLAAAVNHATATLASIKETS